MNHIISESLLKLKLFIENEDYRGYDPYDALKSPLLNLPLIRNSGNFLFLSQQIVKRFPINLRPLLFIRKGLNPVTLGLCVQGYVDLEKSGLISKDECETTCVKLIQLLEELIPKGFSGACWGYDFPWQSRHFKLGALQPSIVATGIITNALFKYYQHTKNEKALSMCKSSCDFMQKDLNAIEDSDGNFCFSYTPYDHYKVYNASMKGARTLAQVFSVTGEQKLRDKAYKAVAFVAKNQNSDGSWFYAQGEKGRWIDSYHTGYILDCMKEYAEKTSDKSFEPVCEKGFSYFENAFFENEAVPKFYHNSTFPIDCTAAAQSILTLCNFKKITHAEKVALYMIENMQAENGGFHFRKSKFHTEKTSFMRWSNAWMFAALSGFANFSSPRSPDVVY